MKKSRDYLNYLLSQAQTEANETYEQELENCFNHYFEKECDANDNISEARDDFENSSYYFLTVEDFEERKMKNLNILKFKAEKELIKEIDRLNIEELRELKEIYYRIVKIVDYISHQYLPF